MTHSPHNRRYKGVAMVVAVALLGLVAAGIVMVVTIASGEFHRTQNDRQQTQIMQYHLACIVFAQEQLQTGQKTSGPITLPEWGPAASVKWINNDDRNDLCEITIDNHTWTHQFERVNSAYLLSR